MAIAVLKREVKQLIQSLHDNGAHIMACENHDRKEYIIIKLKKNIMPNFANNLEAIMDEILSYIH